MALSPTITLPLTLRQPIKPKAPPKNASAEVLSKHIDSLNEYLDQQQTGIQSMYNAIVNQMKSLILVGEFSDLPPAGTPGRLFVSTDLTMLLCDTGSTWLQVDLVQGP